MTQVLLADPLLATEMEHFRRLLPKDVTLTVTTSYDDAEFARLATEAHVLVNTIRRIDAAAMAAAPHVRFANSSASAMTRSIWPPSLPPAS